MRGHFLGRRRADRHELEPDRAPGVGDRRRHGGIEGRDPVDPVSRDDRHEHLDTAVRGNDGGDTRERRTSTPRTPRSNEPQGKVIDDHGGGPGERPGQRLGRFDEEERIGPARTLATIGAPRRLGHGGRVRVDPDDEGARVRVGPRQDGAAVARSEIDDHPVGPGDPVR